MYFILLKVIIGIQFALIFLQKESVNSALYVLFDIVFKISLGLFLMVFFFAEKFNGIHVIDRYIISLAGGLLFFDALTGSVPKFLSKYGIALPSWWPIQKS